MKPRSILMFGAFLLQNSSNLCSDVVLRSMKKKKQQQNKTKKRKKLITHLKDMSELLLRKLVLF